MKPITEHQEFKGWIDNKLHIEKNYPRTYDDEDMYDWSIMYEDMRLIEESAKAAQSILQKEHDEEMIAFLEWVIKYEYIPLKNGMWAQVPENSKYDITTYRLLQLFRERDGR